MKYTILILAFFTFCSCSTVKGLKKDSRVVTPKKTEVQNKFIRYADEKANPEKQILSPQQFTKWTISTSIGSFLLFQFLKWKQIV